MLKTHYNDVIMTTMASQITSLTVVYSNVYSYSDQRKHQSSASLAFVWGIHRDRWIPRTKGQLRGKCFHMMTSSCNGKKCIVMQNAFPCHHTLYIYNGPGPLSLTTFACNSNSTEILPRGDLITGHQITSIFTHATTAQLSFHMQKMSRLHG